MRVFFALFLMLLTASPTYGAVSAGLVVGNPTGLTLKSWQGQHALDFGVGWYTAGYRDVFGNHWSTTEVEFTGDYVVHNYGLFHLKEGKLPLYYGLGAAVWAGSVGALGVRVPVGLDFIFAGAPLDIFAEIVPTMYLAPSTHLEMGAAFGVRYRFQ